MYYLDIKSVYSYFAAKLEAEKQAKKEEKKEESN